MKSERKAPRKFKKLEKKHSTESYDPFPDYSPEPNRQKNSKRSRSEEDEVTDDEEIEISKRPGNGDQSKKRKPSDTSPPKTPVKTQAVKRPVDDEERSTTPETKLIKHLKELFEMERILRKTDPLVVELVMGSSADPKYSDGWKEVGRGTLLLKEGLRTITQAQKRLPFTDYTDDDSTPEHL